jgi:hypothetical protein
VSSLTARRAPALVLAVFAVVASLLAAPPALGDDEVVSVSTESSSLAAEEALDTAEEVLDGEKAGDATLALRDLALRLDDLDADDRAAAQRILARPSAPGDQDSYGRNAVTTTCSAVVCVHYVVAGPEATSPSYAATTLATATSVHNRYVAAGYKAPKSDAGRGGNNLTDIYIANIGDRRLYGYCTTDEKIRDKAPWDRWAYCVVDNDYSSSEFPSNTPLENLQVTVAHEYFHAVQYAYDFAEDGWFLEATAAWVEDELYDAVDDNRQYLAASPLRQPKRSMDWFSPQTGYHYGIWIWFRYLSERFPKSQGGLPTIVRDMWGKADGSGSIRRDQYSWQAVSSVLRARGTSPVRAFAAFSAANRRPARIYSEGRAYRKSPLAGKALVGKAQVGRQVRLNHLASATYRLTPRATLRSPKWKVRVNIDMAPSYRGSAAIVTTYYRNGVQRARNVRLNKYGNGRLATPFSSRKVAFVEVTLANGSGRFECWQRTLYSCQGKSKDNRLLEKFSARTFR